MPGSNSLKYFISNFGYPYMPATIKGNWDYTNKHIVAKLCSSRSQNGVSRTITIIAPSDLSYILFGRFVSDGFPTDINFDQTGPYTDYASIIVGTKTQLDGNFHLYYYLYVTQGDSDLVRGVIFSNLQHASELTTTARGWKYTNNFIGFNALARDRLVLEIGYRNVYPYGINYNGYLYCGATGATDLTDGDTAVTTNPGTITFEYLLP